MLFVSIRVAKCREWAAIEILSGIYESRAPDETSAVHIAAAEAAHRVACLCLLFGTGVPFFQVS